MFAGRTQGVPSPGAGSVQPYGVQVEGEGVGAGDGPAGELDGRGDCASAGAPSSAAAPADAASEMNRLRFEDVPLVDTEKLLLSRAAGRRRSYSGASARCIP